MLVTPALLQRHRGTLKCKVCGQPLEEGEEVVRRRVNSRVRYFHRGCIYAETKQAAEAEAPR